MESNIVYFYTLFFITIGSALGIVFAPKQYMSVFSLFVLIICSSVLYWNLNAKYIALAQFILCGVVLCSYLFILLKKIDRLGFQTKLKSLLSIVFSLMIVIFIGVITVFFFNEEYNNVIYSIFNYVPEKVSDNINFSDYVFPLILSVILVSVTSVVTRVYLTTSTSNLSKEENK